MGFNYRTVALQWELPLDRVCCTINTGLNYTIMWELIKPTFIIYKVAFIIGLALKIEKRKGCVSVLPANVLLHQSTGRAKDTDTDTQYCNLSFVKSIIIETLIPILTARAKGSDTDTSIKAPPLSPLPPLLYPPLSRLHICPFLQPHIRLRSIFAPRHCPYHTTHITN